MQASHRDPDKTTQPMTRVLSKISSWSSLIRLLLEVKSGPMKPSILTSFTLTLHLTGDLSLMGSKTHWSSMDCGRTWMRRLTSAMEFATKIKISLVILLPTSSHTHQLENAWTLKQSTWMLSIKMDRPSSTHIPSLAPSKSKLQTSGSSPKSSAQWLFPEATSLAWASMARSGSETITLR